MPGDRGLKALLGCAYLCWALATVFFALWLTGVRPPIQL